jgi:hypothetical protein
MMPKLCLLICFFCGALQAQSDRFQFYGKSVPEIKKLLETPAFPRHYSLLSATIPAGAACSTPEESPLFFTPGLAQWKPEDLPFFCKIEHQMGKKMPVQFKFRLGSVDYVDWLEGKRE